MTPVPMNRGFSFREVSFMVRKRRLLVIAAAVLAALVLLAWWDSERRGLPREISNSIGMKLVLIPAGRFLMGSPDAEAGRQEHEGPRHEVVIAQPFYMGIHEVTQAEYQQVMGTNPSLFQGERGGGPEHPVENVSWEDADAFCRALTELDRHAGRSYRLPTEAEWEYAYRAGSASAYFFNSEPATAYSWIKSNAGNKTQPVGRLQPNAWGLHDMAGNVWEWCADYYHPYGREPDAAGSERRVYRGGSWLHDATYCRAAMRNHHFPSFSVPTLGFRVVCAVDGRP